MNINGLFNVVAKAPMLGVQKGKFLFETQDSKVTCLVTFMGRDVPLKNLVIDGNSFTATADAPGPTGSVHMDVIGSIDGDSITGVMKSPMGEMTYNGERAV